MSEISPDTDARSAVSGEIVDINQEFLRLLTHPAVVSAETVLGLDGGIVAGLRALTEAELRQVARSPVLLADFRPFPGFGEVRDEASNIRAVLMATRGAPRGLEQNWRAELEGFANRLLTCVWQTSRRDSLLTALCIGMDPQRSHALADLDFLQVSRFARESAGALRVRLAAHPHFWPDLIRLVRNGDEQQRTASRLSALQLAVAEHWPGGRAPARLAYAD